MLRLRKRAFAAFALLAMALQLVGTFGHVHLADRSTQQIAAKARAIVAAPLEQAAHLASDATDVSHALPSLPGGDGDPVCAVCLLGSLVASGLAASAPTVALPIVYARLEPSTDTERPDAFDLPTSFWSRGPPTA